MLRSLAVVAAIAVGATVAYAQNVDAIKKRQDAMDAMDDATKPPINMLKGTEPFDLAKVQAALATYQAEAAKAKDFFPDDSKTGKDTEALPVIWTKKTEFLAHFDKLAADAKAASAAITNEATFKSEFNKIMRDCVACHKEYRAPSK
ncbi:MAG: cytochrome c [Hyphomicrobiaceae bacterium]|jgi:cytochrome c556